MDASFDEMTKMLVCDFPLISFHIQNIGPNGEYFVMENEGITDTHNIAFNQNHEKSNRKTVFERQVGARNMIFDKHQKKHEQELKIQIEQTMKHIQDVKNETECDYRILEMDKKKYLIDGGNKKKYGNVEFGENGIESDLNNSDRIMMNFYKTKSSYLDKDNVIPVRKISLPDKLPSAVADARKIMRRKSLDRQADAIKAKITPRLNLSNLTDSTYKSSSTDSSSPKSEEFFINHCEDDTNPKHIQSGKHESLQADIERYDDHNSKLLLPPIESQSFLSPRCPAFNPIKLQDAVSDFIKGSVTHRSNSQNNRKSTNYETHGRNGDSRDDSMIKYSSNNPKVLRKSLSTKERLLQQSLRKSKEKAEEDSKVLQNKVESFLKTFEHKSKTLSDFHKMGIEDQNKSKDEKPRIITRSQSRMSSKLRPNMSVYDRAMANWRRAINKIIFQIALKKTEQYLITISQSPDRKYKIFNNASHKLRLGVISSPTELSRQSMRRRSSGVPLNTAERALRHSDSYRLEKLMRRSLQESMPNSHLYDLSEDTGNHYATQMRYKKSTRK
ncbi:unnamed protein product [Owenia fusiformis]|uniref:Uncharacterized protein n=1 Tax=Owenia fusiformis TaxID=6347 RepID=A0A8J1TVX6_OWEFU|nr:unnamed protein product [Owenia fusiformis]